MKNCLFIQHHRYAPLLPLHKCYTLHSITDEIFFTEILVKEIEEDLALAKAMYQCSGEACRGFKDFFYKTQKLCACAGFMPTWSYRYRNGEGSIDTIRLKLLKISARIKITARKVWARFNNTLNREKAVIKKHQTEMGLSIAIARALKVAGQICVLESGRDGWQGPAKDAGNGLDLIKASLEPDQRE